MTNANILPTPAKWPHVLLPDAVVTADEPAAPATAPRAAKNTRQSKAAALAAAEAAEAASLAALQAALQAAQQAAESPAGPTDPADLDAALARGAFAGLARAVREMTAGEIVAALAESGLRGRGGAGYPTSEKWRACALAVADRRYVVVHAYQADPAVFADRVLLEQNPYAVLEGAAIAAVTVGATEVIVALRVEATEAIAVLEATIAAAEAANYLGDDVLGSGRDIHVTVKALQGAYMLGEETVLLKGIEGKRGQPEQQPPYATTKGLYGRPTLIHNPQTFAVIPGIIAGTAEPTAPKAQPVVMSFAAFTAAGSPAAPAAPAMPDPAPATADSRGTVLVQVSGSVANPGLAEVPLGTTLREIVALAGGVAASHTIKAILVGGPSGGILPAAALDTPYEFDALEAAGAHMGSGSVVVVDERTCLVDLASVLTRFCADEACGKTIPCRIGLRRLAEIGARICEGQPRGDEITRLTDLSADIVASRLCDHERRSTLPLLSIVRYFRDELDAHLIRSTCPAGICHPMAARAGAVS
jgi:NADH:ubiquinone oxidoreductase subunit F (NADH-binding)